MSAEHLGPVPVAALEALDRVRRMSDSDFRPVYRGPRRNVGGPVEPVYSGAAEDIRDPRLLGADLRKIVGAHGWQSSLEIGAVMGRWPELVGDSVASHCTPESFEPPMLVIRASSTTWATQLRIMQVQLLDRLERELGSRIVQEITILGPAQRSWKHGRRSVAGRGPRDTYG